MSGPTTDPRRVLLVGGTSEIGRAVLDAMRLPPTAHVVLAGRSRSDLQAVAATLGCQSSVEVLSGLDDPACGDLVSRVTRDGPVDVALLCIGILGDQKRAEREPEHAAEILDVDLRAQVSLALHLAARMRREGRGTIVVFSSIAAARARRTNFVYGAAKAGLDAFANGLADSLHDSGVRVLIVRPGFVVGRMTAGMAPAPLSVHPATVGRATARALARGRRTVWVPAALRFVAAAMQVIPGWLWRRVRR